MADQKLFTIEEQIALVDQNKERMDAVARAWLENPKVKASLFRLGAEPAECKEAS